MGRPPLDADAVDTRERLLGSALEAFGRDGIERARLADIAADAGISRPSLLYHFGSKDALYDAVVRSSFLELGAELAGAMETEGSFRQRFGEMLHRSVDFLEARPALARLLVREMLDDRGATHAALLDAGLPLLDRIEAFVKREGRGIVRARVPVRAALMTLVSTIVNAIAAGPLREPLWGSEASANAIARLIFFDDAAAAEGRTP